MQTWTPEKREYQRNKRKRWKDAGLCMRCGKRSAVEGRTSCAECIEEAIEKRKEKRSQGVCTYCAKQNPVIPGTSYCQDCCVKITRRNKKIHQERLAGGLCTNCGENPSRSGKLTCSKCAKETRKFNQRNKKKCFDYYGRVCTCCKQEFDEIFL